MRATFLPPTKPASATTCSAPAWAGRFDNKTIFFFNYEGLRNNGETTTFENVPTQAEAKGDFSSNKTVIREPAAAARSLPGQHHSRIALRSDRRATRRVLSRAERCRPSHRKQQLPLKRRHRQSEQNYVTRIDHNFNENNRMYGRLLSNTNSNSVRQFTNGGTMIQRTFSRNLTPTYPARGSTISTTINEFRFTWERRTNINQTAGFGAAGNCGIQGVDPKTFRAWQ